MVANKIPFDLQVFGSCSATNNVYFPSPFPKGNGRSPRMIRNIIFDWSGTLADDFICVLAATNNLFCDFGRPEMSAAEFRAKFRLPFMEFYAEHLPEATEQHLENNYHKYFASIQKNVCLLPEARGILKFCKATGRRLYLLSTIQKMFFELQANKFGIRRFFDKTYTNVPDKRVKIHEILTTHHLDPRETAFIGDMVHDIEAAQEGGVWSVAVLTGFDPLEKLASASPDLIVRNLDAFCAFL